MRSNHLLKDRRQASYTVESAFVVPIVFFVIIFFLAYTFYCFDRAKLQSELDDLIRKASAYMAYEVDLYTDEVVSYKLAEKNILFVWFGDRTVKEGILTDYVKKRLESEYYITSVDSITVSTSVTKVKITGIAHMRIPVINFISGVADYTFNVEFSQEDSMLPREEKARIMSAVMALGTNIKGADQVLNMVRKFINRIH